MLGPAKPRRLDQPIAVSLETLIPRDHFYRHLETTLDLSFVRDWTRELYADLDGGVVMVDYDFRHRPVYRVSTAKYDVR